MNNVAADMRLCDCPLVAEIYKWLLDLYDAHNLRSLLLVLRVIYELVALIPPIIEGKQCDNAAGPPDHKFFLTNSPAAREIYGGHPCVWLNKAVVVAVKMAANFEPPD